MGSESNLDMGMDEGCARLCPQCPIPSHSQPRRPPYALLLTIMPPDHNTLRFTLPPATSPWANPLIGLANPPPVAARRTPSRRIPDTLKLHALSIYAETGNQSQAAKVVGVEQSTVHGWVHDEDSATLIDDLRSTIRYHAGWRLAQMVQRGMDRLDEAWDKGVPHVTKNGAVIYTNESPKDAAITMSILLDKWMLISGAISQSAALVAGMDKLSKQVASLGAGLLGEGVPKVPPDSQGPPGETFVE